MPCKIKLQTATLSVLVALAISLSRSIDAGDDCLRSELEHIFSLIPRART